MNCSSELIQDGDISIKVVFGENDLFERILMATLEKDAIYIPNGVYYPPQGLEMYRHWVKTLRCDGHRIGYHDDFILENGDDDYNSIEYLTCKKLRVDGKFNICGAEKSKTRFVADLKGI